jgi:hypothetical protein
MTAFTRNGLVKLDVPDIMSVLLIPGSGRQVWEGVGDAIFIDGRRRIVAVADGSERNPSAGAAFLRRFRSGISDVIDPQMELILSDEVMGNLASATNLLIRGTSFHDGTTFSAVIVGHDNHFAILHTGDSLILRAPVPDGVDVPYSAHHILADPDSYMMSRTSDHMNMALRDRLPIRQVYLRSEILEDDFYRHPNMEFLRFDIHHIAIHPYRQRRLFLLLELNHDNIIGRLIGRMKRSIYYAIRVYLAFSACLYPFAVERAAIGTPHPGKCTKGATLSALQDKEFVAFTALPEFL